MSASHPAHRGNALLSPRRLKNEAKQLRQLHPELSHLAALDEIAKARGWSSYKAVERAWKAREPASPGFLVTLSARWVDQATNAQGVMYSHVALTEPWANFLPLAARRQMGTLRDFRILHADRSQLVGSERYLSWLSCAYALSKASRQLVFVDAMRVLPTSHAKAVKAFRGDPHRMLTSRYPDSDHESLWFDPETGLHFILNQPYQVDHLKQDEVLASREMTALTTRDWTLHNPQGTFAQLIAPVQDRMMLAEVFQRSKALPTRFSQITFTDDEGRKLDIFR